MKKFFGATLAILLLAGCASSGDKPLPPAAEIVIRNLAATVADIITLYGPLPDVAADTIVAARDYGEGVCAVVLDGADPLVVLAEPRARFDAAVLLFEQSAGLEPPVILATRSVVRTTRDLIDYALYQEVEPDKLARPCEILRGLPVILPRAQALA